MQGLRSWLGKTVQAVKQGQLGPGEGCTNKLRIVMGNTSCDMDSAIGAIALAYYYTMKSGGEAVWVPVINAPKKDFYVNLEIATHLDDCKIDKDELFYYDEFRESYPDPDMVEEVALIDHNVLDVDQADLGSKVTYVIDHHVDSGAYKGQLKDKVCRLVGSACSLVALMIQEDEKLFADDLAASEGDANLSTLLGAAIVLDTYYFKEELKDKKWTDEDSKAHEYLSQTADLGHDYWARLNTAKFDVQAGLQLGLKGICIRDYKNYNLEAGIMGVAVSTGSLETLLNHFGLEEFAKTSAELCVERNLGLFVIVSIQATEKEDGEVVLQKGISIFQPKQYSDKLTEKYDGLKALLEGWEDM